VLHGVHANTVHLIGSEGVRPHPRDLPEVEGGPLPAGRGVHPARDQGAATALQAHRHLRGLGGADGVVDDVDGAGVGHRQPVGRRLETPPDHAAAYSMTASAGSESTTVAPMARASAAWGDAGPPPSPVLVLVVELPEDLLGLGTA